jgi:Domain of unknown function (DUF4190)
MSDTSQGHGWWLASDGKWYPPELWTGSPEARPGGATGHDPHVGSQDPRRPDSTTTSTSPGAPLGKGGAAGLGAPGSSGAPSGYAASGYVGPGPTGAPPTPGSYPAGTYPTYAYGQPTPYPALNKKTNGMAIAALVCGIGGFFFFIPAVLGIVFGFVARSQIRQSNGTQGGEGLALTGIIVGFAWIALLIFVIVVSATTTNTTNNGAVILHLATGGLSA